MKGTVKRTLKKESKEHEIVSREPDSSCSARYSKGSGRNYLLANNFKTSV
jgi:hypothetical protein